MFLTRQVGQSPADTLIDANFGIRDAVLKEVAEAIAGAGIDLPFPT